MIDSSEALDHAVTQLTELHKLHGEFTTLIAKDVGTRGRTGSLAVSDAHITANCLNVPLKSTHRPVAVEGKPVGNEYVFYGETDGHSVQVLKLLLTPSGSILLNDLSGPELCQFDSPILTDKLTDVLASHLLRSPIFELHAPSGA